MSHTIHEKTKLLGRVRRIRGQVEALEHALEDERGCTAVMQQIAAVRGAINGLMAEVIEDHIHVHVANPALASEDERAHGVEELLEVVRAYLK
jgi:DNA-binding FrmR family transcriptional regulator